MTEPYGLQLAKKLAYNSTYTNSNDISIKMGAVIMYGNKVISKSVNKNKTHPIMDFYNKCMPWTKVAYLHAEMGALINAHWRMCPNMLSKCTVYVARKLNKEGFGYARPCDACMSALRDAGITKVVYTTEYGYAEEYI